MSDRVILDDDDGLVMVDAEFVAQPAPVLEKPEPAETSPPAENPQESSSEDNPKPVGETPSQRTTSTKPKRLTGMSGTAVRMPSGLSPGSSTL